MREVRGASLPGDGDQVARWDRFKRAHPDAGYEHDAPWLTGTVTVCGQRLEARRTDLGAMTGDLEREAIRLERDACAVIEGKFPGWRAWTSDDGRWYATRGRAAEYRLRVGAPATVDADGADALREEVARVESDWACWA